MGLVDFRLICSTCILIMSYVNRFARNYILWLLVARFLSFSLYFLYHTASTLPLHYFLLLCVSTSVRPFKYRNKFICTSGAIAKHALTIWIKTAFDCSKEPHCVAIYGRPACELLKEYVKHSQFEYCHFMKTTNQKSISRVTGKMATIQFSTLLISSYSKNYFFSPIDIHCLTLYLSIRRSYWFEPHANCFASYTWSILRTRNDKNEYPFAI